MRKKVLLGVLPAPPLGSQRERDVEALTFLLTYGIGLEAKAPLSNDSWSAVLQRNLEANGGGDPRDIAELRELAKQLEATGMRYPFSREPWHAIIERFLLPVQPAGAGRPRRNEERDAHITRHVWLYKRAYRDETIEECAAHVSECLRAAGINLETKTVQRIAETNENRMNAKRWLVQQLRSYRDHIYSSVIRALLASYEPQLVDKRMPQALKALPVKAK